MKAVFLARDGVINQMNGFISHPNQIQFIEGIFELCYEIQQKGYSLIIITNQPGVGRGLISEQQLDNVHQWMVNQFKRHQIKIEGIYYCPHHPTKGKGDFRKECDCRKPKPGLIIQAATKHNIELKQSIFIGDKLIDMQAAESSGIHNRILFAQYKEDFKQVEAQFIQKLADASRFIE
ncbi:D-glycero-alpha-D-manno-heptose-1,7-bisphosphate 7-phosphatase [Thalassotalea ganghwensis]